MTANPKKIVAEPSLKDLLDVFALQVLLTTNCHAIATVQSFDSSKQTVTASMNYKRTLNGSELDYPILVDCPVWQPLGGSAGLSMPIKKGDACLIAFNDRDMDNWFSSGQVMELNTNRVHSFSDAIALVGLRSAATALSNYDSVRAVLFNGTTGVGVGPTLVKIYNQTTTLLQLIQQLIVTIEGVQTIPAVVGTPLPLGPASIAALETVKAAFGGLLE